MTSLTATTLRNIIGDLEVDQTRTSRDVINTKMRAILDEATDPWGIKVNRVELKNILPPADIQSSMEKQMKAERDRRQAILQAEGTKKSAILIAEGEKESAILRADADKQAAILKAEAEPGNQAVVDIAKSQVGNVGGQPYWSWYGFNSRVEWCACFVSWCYGQMGLSEPRFAACQSQDLFM